MPELTIEQQEKAIKLLQDAYDVIGMAKFELGEDWDEAGDSSLEEEIGGFLHDINENCS